MQLRLPLELLHLITYHKLIWLEESRKALPNKVSLEDLYKTLFLEWSKIQDNTLYNLAYLFSLEELLAQLEDKLMQTTTDLKNKPFILKDQPSEM